MGKSQCALRANPSAEGDGEGRVILHAGDDGGKRRKGAVAWQENGADVSALTEPVPRARRGRVSPSSLGVDLRTACCTSGDCSSRRACRSLSIPASTFGSNGPRLPCIEPSE